MIVKEQYRNKSEELREFCCFGDIQKIKALLENNDDVDINSQNKVNGWTALHWAAKRGYTEICQLLLANGADYNIANHNNQLPVDVAAKDNSSLVKLLSTHQPSDNLEEHKSSSSLNLTSSVSTDRLISPPQETEETVVLTSHQGRVEQSDHSLLSHHPECEEFDDVRESRDTCDSEDSMQPPSINIVPSYMSRVKPPNAVSSYAEDYTYPWTKLPNSKGSTPSSTGGRSVNNGVSSTSHHNLNITNLSGSTHLYSGNHQPELRNQQLLSSSANNPELEPSPVAGGSALFSSNESMPVTTSQEVQFYMDRKLPSQTQSAQFRIIKVRVSDQCDKDFVEIDLPVEKLSIQGFLEVSCHELGLEYPVHIERIRKLPNTRLRRDVEIQRLSNYQEVELVLSKHPVPLPPPHPTSHLLSSALHRPLSNPNSPRMSTDVVL